MKGQVFILISIFVLLFLFSLRMGTETVDVSQEYTFFDDYTNLKNEFVRTIDMSLLNQENLQSNLESFITFSSDFYKRKGYDEDVKYSINSSGNVTTVYLNISLSSGNSYLKQDLIINRTLVAFS